MVAKEQEATIRENDVGRTEGKRKNAAQGDAFAFVAECRPGNEIGLAAEMDGESKTRVSVAVLKLSMLLGLTRLLKLVVAIAFLL